MPVPPATNRNRRSSGSVGNVNEPSGPSTSIGVRGINGRCGPARPSCVDADQQFEYSRIGQPLPARWRSNTAVCAGDRRPDQYRLHLPCVVEPVAICRSSRTTLAARRRRHDLADRQRDGHRGLCYQHASADARYRAGDSCGGVRWQSPSGWRWSIPAAWIEFFSRADAWWLNGARADRRCDRPGDLVDRSDGSATGLDG